MPRVSVILPTRNRPAELAEALVSLESQDYRDFEVVLINDGGEDVSYLADKFGETCSILYIGRESSGGASAARNTGIKAASGELIAYLDDDDRYLPHHLSTLVTALDGQAADVVYSDAELCYFESRGRERRVVDRKLVFSRDFDPGALLVYNYLPMPCVMHAKSCLERSGAFDEGLVSLEDWDLLIRLSLHYRFIHVPLVTAEYFKEADTARRSNLLYAGGMRNLANLAAIYRKYSKIADSEPKVAVEQASYFVRRLKQAAAGEHAAGHTDKADLLAGLAAELAAARDNPGRARLKMQKIYESLL
jgi:glycosyltransferase involved in cell wall biosynthesis